MLDEENNIFIAENKIKKLTYSETKFLAYFIEHKREVVSKEQLLRDVNPKYYGILNLISRVNEKIGKYCRIYNRKNIGYKIKYIGGEND